jgi:uncharacterized protein
VKEALRNFRIALAILLLAFVFQQASPVFGQEKLPVKIVDVSIIMPDGIKLSTTVARPDKEGKFPVILTRTSYGYDYMRSSMSRTVQRGYVYILQDVRGRYNSDGVFVPFVNEIKDSDATLKWIRSQPWSNGIIATSGHSYLGFTSLYAAAGKETPPQAIFASDPVASPLGGLYTNGAMNHHFDYYWAILVDGKGRELQSVINMDWEHIFSLLPLKEAPMLGVKSEVPYYKDWVDWDNGSFGKGILPETSQINGKNTAVLLVGGWFDLFCPEVLKLHKLLRTQNSAEKVKVIIGPFDHSYSPPPTCEMQIKNWKIDIGSYQNKWFDHWLKNEPNDVEKEPSVKFFLMGSNEWISSDTFPPAGVKTRSFYLAGGGKANTSKGDGQLISNIPAKGAFDSFTYDPGNPVPTHGGNICCLREMTKAGAMDQSKIEERDDVLVYSTDILDKDITVVGTVEMELYAATDARDTDFTAKLVDAAPDGKAYNIVEGIIRARFKNGMSAPKFITPGKVERYYFTINPTAMTFQKGHRIRLEVSSSNFPRYDRNMNTGGPIGMESTFLKANQKIYHGQKYLSRLILPVWERK